LSKEYLKNPKEICINPTGFEENNYEEGSDEEEEFSHASITGFGITEESAMNQ
jgi:hypothetical protein